MGLIENLRHDDERASALATLVASYTEKLAEVAAAATQKGGKGKGKAPAPKLSAHQRHVRTLMRLSVQCPFESIRDAVTPLVQRLKACDAFTIPQSTTAAFPSVYLAPSDIPSMTECAEAAEAEFIEAFRADGRVSHMTQVRRTLTLWVNGEREGARALALSERRGSASTAIHCLFF
jgi:hypothetical protein